MRLEVLKRDWQQTHADSVYNTECITLRMCCENKGFLPKTCKGQHASLVLSARGFRFILSLLETLSQSLSYVCLCTCIQ